MSAPSSAVVATLAMPGDLPPAPRHGCGDAGGGNNGMSGPSFAAAATRAMPDDLSLPAADGGVLSAPVSPVHPAAAVTPAASLAAAAVAVMSANGEGKGAGDPSPAVGSGGLGGSTCAVSGRGDSTCAVDGGLPAAPPHVRCGQGGRSCDGSG